MYLVQSTPLVEDPGELAHEVVRHAWTAKVRDQIDLERADQCKVEILLRFLFL